MSNKPEIGEKLFKEGYNCSQAVVCAYADELGIDRDALIRLSSSFGGGMGRMHEVCGAVTGMFAVAGLLYGSSDVTDRTAKNDHYKLIRDLAEKFGEINGSIVCRRLLGLEKPDGDSECIKKRPCVEYVKCALEILDKLEEEKKDA